MKIDKKQKEAAKQARDTKRLLLRIEKIASDETDIYRAKAAEALKFLRRLAERDERNHKRIMPDKDGWFDVLYVRPNYEDGNIIIQLTNGEVIPDVYYDEDGLCWSWQPGQHKPITGVVKWKKRSRDHKDGSDQIQE